MADRTSISWTDATWNPISGCSRVSEGCRNCYAEAMAARFAKPGMWGEGLATMVRTPDGKAVPRWTGEVRLNEGALDQPLRWRKRRRIFVNSTADLFHEAVPDEWIDKVFAVMALSPQHTFQILTKRPERMRDWMSICRDSKIEHLRAAIPTPSNLYKRSKAHTNAHFGGTPEERWVYRVEPFVWPLPNVWLGVSVEDQVTADVRIPYLLATPSAVRFISAEPLLGPVDLKRIATNRDGYRLRLDALTGIARHTWHKNFAGGGYDPGTVGMIDYHRPPIDWVIVGGESGPRARPMHPDWVRKIRDQCNDAAVPFHFKQWGEWAPRRAALKADLVNANKSLIVRPDGGVTSGLMEYGPDAWLMDKIGKDGAGRHLDGVEHLAFPGDRA